jgi:hypothetical protein
MKKSLLAIAVFLVSIGIANYVRAKSDSAQIIVRAYVQPKFTMDVSANEVDFGLIKQGSSAAEDKKVSLDCYSNTGNTWEVTVQANPLTHADGQTIIPSDPNFKIYGIVVSEPADFSGGANHITMPISFPDSPTALYTSAPNSRGTVIYDLTIPALNIPSGQKTGVYETIIYLTMTEK